MAIKNTYYFPHDYHARHDPKLERLFIAMGYEGVGIYWCLIEALYEQGGTLLFADLPIYSKGDKSLCERITNVVRDFELFGKDDTSFWSESCNERLRHMEEKREKASQSAHKRWGSDAKAMPTHSGRNAIKESKVKESKGKNKKLKPKLDFTYLEKTNIDKLFKLFGNKDSVTVHLKGMGFYEARIVEAFEKAGIK